jgi:hypothetical protein
LLKLLTIHEEAESAAETLQDQTWSNTRF